MATALTPRILRNHYRLMDTLSLSVRFFVLGWIENILTSIQNFLPLSVDSLYTGDLDIWAHLINLRRNGLFTSLRKIQLTNVVTNRFIMEFVMCLEIECQGRVQQNLLYRMPNLLNCPIFNTLIQFALTSSFNDKNIKQMSTLQLKFL